LRASLSEEVRITARAPFVGRDGELDVVLTAVAQVPHAGLTVVIVSGEAGIGKSRLLSEAADHIGQRGWRLLRVRAEHLERYVPYAALGTALRALTTDNTFTEGLRRDALAALELPMASPSPEVAGTTFGRASAAVGRLLTALTAASPLVVTVDDVHELDDDSLSLLAVVLNRLAPAPIGLVIALRSHVAAPNAAAAELMQRLADSVEVVKIELGMLSRAAVAAVVASALGGPPDEALVAEVHRRADGNPYFAAEIARSLVDSRLVTVDASGARLTGAPQAMHLTRRAAVLRRVMPLGAEAQAVARILAVLRVAALDRIGLIAQVTSLTEASVAAAFDDLVRAHVVVGDAERRYRFSHDVVGDAVYDEIGPAECRRLHRLCAEQLLAERNRIDADLLQLAWHLSESASPGDVQAAVVLSQAAQLTLSGAPEAAAGFCERALALLKDTAPERAGLLALRCRAQARASRPAAAVSSGQEALALLPAGGERFRTAVAVVGSLFSLGRIDEAIEIADEQVRAADVPAALRAQRAVLLIFVNRTEEALLEAGLASSTPPRSPAEEVVVYSQLAILNSMLFRQSETVRYADLALSCAGSSVTLQLQALGVAAFTESLAGLVATAARRLRRADLLTQQTDGPHPFDAVLGVARVVVDWLSGRWDSALETMRVQTVELANRQHVMIAAALTSTELEMRTWRGELALAMPLARKPGPLPRNVASLHAWALAGFQSAQGDVDGARTTLAAAIEAPGTPTYIGLLLSRLAELEVEQGRPDEAERAMRLLIETSRADDSPWANTTLHRTVGLVRGDVEALTEAAREADAEGLVFERARAELALGDRMTAAVAVEGLVQAHQTFARLGTHGLRRTAARRLRQLGAKVPRVRSRAAGLLTQSEEQVARLVQQGMRNRDIAAALHLSPRSVEVYLSRIYGKLRVSSRLELARTLDAMDSGG
jgi:DNA-binding NarL/FixJ family response regulator